MTEIVTAFVEAVKPFVPLIATIVCLWAVFKIVDRF